jgi:hypothetical protein
VSDCSGNPAVKMARAKRALVFTRNCSEKRVFLHGKSKGKNTRPKNCNFGRIFENFLKKIIMKKYILAAGLALGSVGIITTTTQSCMTIATTVGLSVLKRF